MVVALGKEQGLVFADEVDGIKHLTAIHAALQVANHLGGVTLFPMALEGIHCLYYGIDSFIIINFRGVNSKNNRNLALVT